jgi:hypothetical protein
LASEAGGIGLSAFFEKRIVPVSASIIEASGARVEKSCAWAMEMQQVMSSGNAADRDIHRNRCLLTRTRPIVCVQKSAAAGTCPLPPSQDEGSSACAAGSID